jgi:hypothetical protein
MDPDAVAFLNAQGNSNAKEKYALNRLVIDLKQAGLWSKMVAIYPFLGSTAAMQKWNLKDPRDVNAAFRLEFFGGWTFSSNGAKPNGLNAYADTWLSPTTSLSTSSIHFSKYIRNNDLTGAKIEGCTDLANQYFVQINFSSGNVVLGSINSLGTWTQADTIGLFTASRISTTDLKAYKNSTQVASDTVSSNVLPSNRFLIGARNDGFPQFYNPYETAFESIGLGLTSTNVSNLYTIVQRYNTTLGRQV